METVCRACGYERKPTDQAPDWECPSCGKAYAKTSQDASAAFLAPTHRLPVEPGYRVDGQMGLVSWAASLGSLLGFLILVIWLLFADRTSHDLWPVAIFALGLPWLLLVGAYLCRDALLREVGESASGAIFLPLFLPVMGLFIFAGWASLVFEPEKAWFKGFLMAIPFGLTCVAVVRRLNTAIPQIRLGLVWVFLIVFTFMYGRAAFVLGDRWLDRSPPTVYQATVIGKGVQAHKKGADTYFAQLAAWGTVLSGSEVPITRNEYDTMTPDKSVVCIAAHPGALGLAWGQRVPCAEQISMER
jgi:hypothetical protein